MNESKKTLIGIVLSAIGGFTLPLLVGFSLNYNTEVKAESPLKQKDTTLRLFFDEHYLTYYGCSIELVASKKGNELVGTCSGVEETLVKLGEVVKSPSITEIFVSDGQVWSRVSGCHHVATSAGQRYAQMDYDCRGDA